MIKIKVRQSRCAGRECFMTYSGSIPKKIKGVFLKPGCRYCTGGKRTRQFQRRDPKVYVPSWCPLRKSPATLRIYCYKSIQSAYIRLLLKLDGVDYTPNAYNYAMRYEGSTTLTARNIANWKGSETLERFLGNAVQLEEIVEIDDGLTSYFFYFRDVSTLCCIPFDGEKARRNKLEDIHGCMH